MADIAIFKAGKEPQYILSVNTPEYSSDPDVIVNPDISTVQNIPIKFWKRSGDTIIEMTQNEKTVIALNELSDRKSLAETFEVSMLDIFSAFITVINTRLPAEQQITKSELVTAIKKGII